LGQEELPLPTNATVDGVFGARGRPALGHVREDDRIRLSREKGGLRTRQGCKPLYGTQKQRVEGEERADRIFKG